MEPPKLSVIAVGEVLWDVYPDRRLLGGAPFNVACHLHNLRVSSCIVSRVGHDPLGLEILAEIGSRGMPVHTVQVDPHLPTGTVRVSLDALGRPTFRIEAPAAWDALTPDPAALDAAARAHAVVFGSLAQRREPARTTIRSLLKTPALKVFDVNLRPPHDHRAFVEHLLQRSDVAKLNDTELRRLSEWFELHGELPDRCRQVSARFGLQTVCVTRGENGAALYHQGSWFEHPGYRVAVVDTVGSGDAFLAALLWAFLQDIHPAEALAYANAAGAFVATQSGATPPLDRAAIAAIMEGAGGQA